MQDIKNFTLTELREFIKNEKFPRYYTDEIFRWAYKRRKEDFNLMTSISKDARIYLKNNFYFSSLNLLNKEISGDGTEKFLFGLEDRAKIESVIIPEEKRCTLCISTQVGCKFSCAFCLSGKGFKRNLTASEIINQYLYLIDKIAPKEITNIVFMGIGEPLDNFANTLRAINILMEPKGIYFGRRRITLSTSGLIPQIEELAKLNLGIKLSISLHSADDNIRSRIMPVNKKYHLSELIKSIKVISRKEKYPITFEYILLSINTNKAEAKKLVKLLKGINCKLNFISYNLTGGEFMPPSQDDLDSFMDELKRGKIFFTLRKSRGQDISAACGQLRYNS